MLTFLKKYHSLESKPVYLTLKSYSREPKGQFIVAVKMATVEDSDGREVSAAHTTGTLKRHYYF